MNKTFRFAATLGLLGASATFGPPASAPQRAPDRRPRSVAILVYEGAALLDIVGPHAVLSHASQMTEIDGKAAFEVFTVAPGPGPIEIQDGPRIVPDRTLADSLTADVLVIPGGANDPLMKDSVAMRRLGALARSAEIRMSVCNGAWILGALGYLDGIEATTNVGTVAGLRRRFPKARVVEGVRYVDAGAVITTADGATGIEGALHLVGRLLGPEAAREVAEHLAYPWTGDERKAEGDRRSNERPD